LREGGVVEALIEQDSMREATRGQRRSGLVKLVSLFAWGGVGTAISYGTDALILAPLAIGSFCVFVHAAYTEFVNGKRAEHPNGWSYAPLPRGSVLDRLEGRVAADRTLVAPLSGRECVAYELGVRRDAKRDDEAWSWTLLEQRSARLEVGGRRVEGRPHLRFRRELMANELNDRARRALRKRGIDPARPGYTYFESVVRAEEVLTADERESGWVLSQL
jgi:hypothetical protein